VFLIGGSRPAVEKAAQIIEQLLSLKSGKETEARWPEIAVSVIPLAYTSIRTWSVRWYGKPQNGECII
jgi:hypothetical protein